MSKYHYLLVIGFILISTLFIILVFRPINKTFWRDYLKAQVLVLLGYLIWDTWAIYKKAWYFDKKQIIGVYLLPKVPIEEVLFFIVVPLVSVLTYLSLGKIAKSKRVNQYRGKI